jgi:hypothetical protein
MVIITLSTATLAQKLGVKSRNLSKNLTKGAKKQLSQLILK